MGYFRPFNPLTPGKIKISKKWKKLLEISSFYTSVPKNHDYMLHCSWDMVHDGCNCCYSFWAIFCPFTLLIAQKNKISKNWKKKPGDIIILHKCTKTHDQMLYCSWDTARDRCNWLFILGNFLPFYPANSPKK